MAISILLLPGEYHLAITEHSTLRNQYHRVMAGIAMPVPYHHLGQAFYIELMFRNQAAIGCACYSRHQRGKAGVTPEDLDDKKRTCVIGDEVRKNLFGYNDPIGLTVYVERFADTQPYEVVGVLARVRTAGAPARGVEERDLNREVLIPFTTAETRYSDTTVRRSTFSLLALKARMKSCGQTENPTIEMKTAEEYSPHDHATPADESE